MHNVMRILRFSLVVLVGFPVAIAFAQEKAIDDGFQSEGSGNTSVIDFQTGQTVEKIQPYESMPEQFRHRVDEETYKRMNASSPSMAELVEILEAPRFPNIFRDIDSFQTHMSKLRNAPELLGALELTEQQESEIRDLEQQYQDELSTLSKPASRNSVKVVQYKYFKQLEEVFLPLTVHQPQLGCN